MSAVITLTTDFEEQEPFVASMKGVLCTQCPGVQIVDLSHDIPRQDVQEAALFIAGAIPYFPKGTVHIVAVASGSTPIAVSINGQYIVCPDNGVVTLLAEQYRIDEARAITNPELQLSKGGQTYFGRDVFCPAAARLASGASLEEMGDSVYKVALTNFDRPTKESDRLVSGRVIHVNRFGTLVSSIHQSFLEGLTVTNVSVGDFGVGPLSQTYGDVAPGSAVALYGSAGYLEIAYNGDRADKRLDMGLGIIVNVSLDPKGG